MIARDRTRRSAKHAPEEEPSFKLERFGWGAPDRLELSGTFAGLSIAAGDRPELVLAGADGTHRLPAAFDEDAGSSRTTASGTPRSSGRTSPPRSARPRWSWARSPSSCPSRATTARRPTTSGGPCAWSRSPPTPDPARDLLRLEAELLTAREELRETTAGAARAREELRRAQADLEEERAERAADAERFRSGLEQMRAAAESALAAERTAAEAAEAQHRGELDAAAELWEETDEQARTEIAALQARIDEMTEEVAESERLRGELAAARAEADSSRRRIAAARDALDAEGA